MWGGLVIIRDHIEMNRGMKFRTGALLLLAVSLAWAFAAGSLSGVLKDSSGGVIPGANLTLVNTGLRTEFKTTSDTRGFYTFPSLPVGRYDLTIEAAGFQPQKKTNLAVDTDASVAIDVVLEVRQTTEAVTVTATD